MKNCCSRAAGLLENPARPLFRVRAPLVFLLLLLSLASPAPASSPAPFTFVQMCDPQLGFNGYESDITRFKIAIQQINVLHPDFVLICGDLVNKADDKSFHDFNALKKTFTVPCYCAPGNHDVGNTPTRESLRRYRKNIGPDYYSFEHKGAVFIIVNTQLWKAQLKDETAKQESWLRTQLEQASSRGQPVVIVSHYPLFVSEPDEPEEYYNLPLDKRKELLALFQRYGVVAHLAGHTHRTIFREFNGIQFVTSETTSRNFDQQPPGFRLWQIGKERPYTHGFIPLD